MESENVSLFIVHWNQPNECMATLAAFRAQNVLLQATIVDNNSKPEMLDLLNLDSNIELVRLSENKGWGGALNVVLHQWLQQGTTRYCIISAHDAVPEPDCLRLLIVATENDAQIGIACPQYHDPFIGCFSKWRGVFPKRLHPSAVGVAQIVDVPHGTLMLIRRECLEQSGLFDERYFAYGDEHELGLRARRHGWKVAMVWGAIVSNPGTWTESPLRSYLFARNSLLMVRDYAGYWHAAVRAVLILLNTLRLMLRSPGEAFAFSARARFRAVTDYFRGRFGRPDFAG